MARNFPPSVTQPRKIKSNPPITAKNVRKSCAAIFPNHELRNLFKFCISDGIENHNSESSGMDSTVTCAARPPRKYTSAFVS